MLEPGLRYAPPRFYHQISMYLPWSLALAFDDPATCAKDEGFGKRDVACARIIIKGLNAAAQVPSLCCFQLVLIRKAATVFLAHTTQIAFQDICYFPPSKAPPNLKVRMRLGIWVSPPCLQVPDLQMHRPITLRYNSWDLHWMDRHEA